MLADGAERVDLVDRFYSKRVLKQQERIIAALIAETPALANFASLPREEDIHRVWRHYGQRALAELPFLDNRGYDFIVSRAFMEHVTNPVLSLRRMYDALNPDGTTIHKVALPDHGIFTGYGFPVLKFMDIPTALYSLMTGGSPYPNRVPLSRYRDALPGRRIIVADLVGLGAIEKPKRYEVIDPKCRSFC
nr:class I SAM-dependent methyltransferase [Methylocapsa acidiphila]